MNEMFRKFAARVSEGAGGPWPFLLASVVILFWLASGFLFGFTEHWVLAITTPTTIFTFLMVFLIQNAQNRHAFATQLKLDELIRAASSARNHLIDLEHLSDEELVRLKEGFEKLSQRANREIQNQSNSGTSS